MAVELTPVDPPEERPQVVHDRLVEQRGRESEPLERHRAPRRVHQPGAGFRQVGEHQAGPLERRGVDDHEGALRRRPGECGGDEVHDRLGRPLPARARSVPCGLNRAGCGGGCRGLGVARVREPGFGIGGAGGGLRVG